MRIYGIELRPFHKWKFHIIKIRAVYKLRLLWRLKIPQFFCSLLGRHVWENTIDWTHAGKICGRCLKKVVTERWDSKGKFL